MLALLADKLGLLAAAAGSSAPAAPAPADAPLREDMVSLLGRLAPGEPAWLVVPLLALAAVLVVLGFITVFSLFAVWLERKVSARIQCRLGPMDVGPLKIGGRVIAGGLLQTVADGLKLLAKEDIIPKDADKALYVLGPIVVFLGAFGLFAVLPFGPDLSPANLDMGLLYIAAIGSLEAIGVIMSGWASNNKWSLFGTMRAATQVVSYEIPLGLAFATVVLMTGTLNLTEISNQQRGWFTNWFLLANPFTFIAFFVYNIAALAETKRAPFDLPEAESELVSGFHTEYSGMRFSIFFLSEYAAMYLTGALAAVLFLGGFYWGIAPIDAIIYRGGVVGNALGMAAIVTKGVFIVFVQMWVRWTLPRIRLDQVMHLCLRVLLPFGIACLVGAAAWQLVFGDHALFFLDRLGQGG